MLKKGVDLLFSIVYGIKGGRQIQQGISAVTFPLSMFKVMSLCTFKRTVSVE